MIQSKPIFKDPTSLWQRLVNYEWQRLAPKGFSKTQVQAECKKLYDTLSKEDIENRIAQPIEVKEPPKSYFKVISDPVNIAEKDRAPKQGMDIHYSF